MEDINITETGKVTFDEFLFALSQPNELLELVPGAELFLFVFEIFKMFLIVGVGSSTKLALPKDSIFSPRSKRVALRVR